MSFIIRNKTSGPAVDIDLGDLGITLHAGEDLDLKNTSPEQIAISEDLPAFIGTGEIVVLDPLGSGSELTQAGSLDVVSQFNDPITRAVSEDDMPYTKRVDFISNFELYRGEALPGSSESAAVWRIRHITISMGQGDVVELYADGNASFDNVWADRLILSYS